MLNIAEERSTQQLWTPIMSRVCASRLKQPLKVQSEKGFYQE